MASSSWPGSSPQKKKRSASQVWTDERVLAFAHRVIDPWLANRRRKTPRKMLARRMKEACETEGLKVEGSELERKLSKWEKESSEGDAEESNEGEESKEGEEDEKEVEANDGESGNEDGNEDGNDTSMASNGNGQEEEDEVEADEAEADEAEADEAEADEAEADEAEADEERAILLLKHRNEAIINPREPITDALWSQHVGLTMSVLQKSPVDVEALVRLSIRKAIGLVDLVKGRANKRRKLTSMADPLINAGATEAEKKAFEKHLQDLEAAAAECHRISKEGTSFARFHAAARLAALCTAFVQEGKKDKERSARSTKMRKFLVDEGLGNEQTLGIRVLTLCFLISRRNMAGLFWISMLWPNFSDLRKLSNNAFYVHCLIITACHWPVSQLVKSGIGHLWIKVIYISKIVLPAFEKVLIRHASLGKDSPYSEILVVPKKGLAENFGIRSCGKILYAVKPWLIDSGYKRIFPKDHFRTDQAYLTSPFKAEKGRKDRARDYRILHLIGSGINVDLRKLVPFGKSSFGSWSIRAAKDVQDLWFLAKDIPIALPEDGPYADLLPLKMPKLGDQATMTTEKIKEVRVCWNGLHPLTQRYIIFAHEDALESKTIHFPSEDKIGGGLKAFFDHFESYDEKLKCRKADLKA